jgi:3-oxoacyl-[acyl-carrier protein] reductase
VDFGLTGKVALVGGSSRGLGYACARELATEGAKVSLCARDGDQAVAAARRISDETGSEAVGFGIDLSITGAPEAWAAASRECLGDADILVHNTGGPPPGHFEDLDDVAWEAAFELLVLSAVRLFRAVLPGMRRRNWGRIVAIESISVKEPIDGLLLSNALRPGVVAVVKALSRSVAADGITVNCVAPGSYATERARELAAASAAKTGVSVDTFLRQKASSFPRRRPGEPEELAAVVAFLCSQRAANINGATVVADGGAVRSLT